MTITKNYIVEHHMDMNLWVHCGMADSEDKAYERGIKHLLYMHRQAVPGVWVKCRYWNEGESGNRKLFDMFEVKKHGGKWSVRFREADVNAWECHAANKTADVANLVADILVPGSELCVRRDRK